MTSESNRVSAEVTKFSTYRPLWALPLIAIALTWILTYVTGLSDVQVTGGDFEAAYGDESIAFTAGQAVPLEYMGFDLMNFGLLISIALGAIYAGSEYGNGLIRSSLIADPRRVGLFSVKASLLTVVVGVTMLLAMGIGTVLRHVALGEYGLDPLAMTPVMWRNIGGVALTCAASSLIAFAIGTIARSAIVPLILTIPLSVGLGDFLITIWEPAKYLPPAAAANLYSVADGLHLPPNMAAIVMTSWGLILTVIAGTVFARRDA